MSGSNILDILSHPAAADPSVYTRGIEGLNALRDTQAKQAIADITQQAIDPQGRVDPAKLNLLISQNPRAAWAGLGALKSTQELQGQQITQQGQSLEQNLAKAKWANSAAGSLTRLGPNITQEDAISALHDGLTQGILTPAEYQRQVSQLPTDAAGLHAWASQHQFTAMSVQQQLEQGFGTTGTEISPTGARVGTVQRPASQGGGLSVQPQAGVPLGLDPGQQAQFQQWLQGEVEVPDPKDPSGVQTATRQQMFQRMGVDPKLFYPGGSGGASSASPAAGPAANAQSASPNVRTTPALPNAGQPLSMPSAPNIETQKAGAGMGIALTQRAGQVPDNQSNLGNMLTDANKLDSMGAGSSREAYLNSFFQKWSGSGLLGNSTQQQIAAAESFNKIGNIMASNQMSALGASDARQQLAIGANPHLDLSKLGNEQIIHMLQGNEDAIAAKSGAWENWKLTHGAGSYAQFQNDLNKNFDLRVFQQQYMNKDELDALKKQLKSQGNYEEFIRKVLHARAQKWIQ